MLLNISKKDDVVASAITQKVDSYLLLYLSNLELVFAKLFIIYILAFLFVSLCDNILHLSHKTFANLVNRLACFFESILRSTFEVGFDFARDCELCYKCRNVVVRNYKLLEIISFANNVVRSLY